MPKTAAPAAHKPNSILSKSNLVHLLTSSSYRNLISGTSSQHGLCERSTYRFGHEIQFKLIASLSRADIMRQKPSSGSELLQASFTKPPLSPPDISAINKLNYPLYSHRTSHMTFKKRLMTQTRKTNHMIQCVFAEYKV